MGRVWVSIDGPYNEHLVRDVGAAVLGLGLVALVALFRREAVLTAVAGLGSLAFGLPHVIYHARNLDTYTESSDKFASVGGLAFTTAAAAVAFVAGWLELQNRDKVRDSQ
jgi:hypothetical protein